MMRQTTMMKSGAQNFDPNLQEYTGTKAGLPAPLWTPNECKQADFFQSLGLKPEDFPSGELPQSTNFLVWSQFVLTPKAAPEEVQALESSPELVQKSMQQQDDELSKIETPARPKHESDQ